MQVENILEVYTGDSTAFAIGVVHVFLGSRYGLVKEGELQGGDPVTLVAKCCAMTKNCIVPLQWAQFSLA